jgi:hypothetical protein
MSINIVVVHCVALYCVVVRLQIACTIGGKTDLKEPDVLLRQQTFLIVQSALSAAGYSMGTILVYLTLMRSTTPSSAQISPSLCAAPSRFTQRRRRILTLLALCIKQWQGVVSDHSIMLQSILDTSSQVARLATPRPGLSVAVMPAVNSSLMVLSRNRTD